MHFLQAINSDLGVLIVCNKTGGTIKGDKNISWVRNNEIVNRLFCRATHILRSRTFMRRWRYIPHTKITNS